MAIPPSTRKILQIVHCSGHGVGAQQLAQNHNGERDRRNIYPKQFLQEPVACGGGNYV